MYFFVFKKLIDGLIREEKKRYNVFCIPVLNYFYSNFCLVFDFKTNFYEKSTFLVSLFTFQRRLREKFQRGLKIKGGYPYD